MSSVFRGVSGGVFGESFRPVLGTSKARPRMPAATPLALFYADAFDATKRAVPNAALSNSLASNKIRFSRRLFSNTSYWVAFGCTATDDAATAPDTTMEASTVVAAGNFRLFITNSLTLTNGQQYTLAVNVKRNTGSDQFFTLQDEQVGSAGMLTATASWQRFTYTYDRLRQGLRWTGPERPPAPTPMQRLAYTCE